MTLREVRVRKFIRSTSVGSSTHIDVACLDGYQFVVADVEATDAAGNSILGDLRFALEVDGEQYPRADQDWYWAFPPGSYDRPGLPAVPAPIGAATEAAFVWRRSTGPPVRWTIPAETVDLLHRAPSFTVQSFETPDSVRRGETFEATVTVANTGEIDGRFITEFGAGPLSDHDEVSIAVSAGTDRTHSESMDPPYPDHADEIDVTLDWGCGRLDRTVSVNE